MRSPFKGFTGARPPWALAAAAALGLHWLYDPDRIAALHGPIVFRTPDPSDFDGAKGVFVHHGNVQRNLIKLRREARPWLVYGELMNNPTVGGDSFPGDLVVSLVVPS